ncbi:MAG: Fic family protein [Candidatus Brocadiales bacterium]|nr:Fic family protein [Candidatus Brocadiales bacterium]
MFKPKYSITPNVLNNLIKTAEAKAVIDNAYLVPKWEVALRREALIKNAHASTSIEGNPLSLEQVSALAMGRDIMTTRKAKAEVLNYLKILEDLPGLAEDGKITEKVILKIHRLLTKDVLENPDDSGVYRNRQVVIGNRLTGVITFRPPDIKDVPVLMKEFVKWLNSKDASETNPVLTAGISHYEFVRIHPFIDGNGRAARALASLILYLRGFDTKRFFALDDYYDSDRPSYYKALQGVDSKTLDITAWLEYFTYGVALQIEKVKERVLSLSSDLKRKRLKGQIALTERQMRIVERINNYGYITNKTIREMFDLSDEGALKEIKKLLSLGVIRPDGSGRNIRYLLA